MKFRNHNVYVFVDLFYRACLPTDLLGHDDELVGGLWPSPKNITIAISTNHRLSIIEHNTMRGLPFDSQVGEHNYNN